MKKRVFIFDDNQEILDLCTLILEDVGYEIRSSETALDIAKQVSEFKPDVILMDNWLPDISGIEATQLLKQDSELKKIPVVFFSANNDLANLAQQAGADAHLPKPFDIVELENLVAQLTKSITF